MELWTYKVVLMNLRKCECSIVLLLSDKQLVNIGVKALGDRYRLREACRRVQGQQQQQKEATATPPPPPPIVISRTPTSSSLINLSTTGFSSFVSEINTDRGHYFEVHMLEDQQVVGEGIIGIGSLPTTIFLCLCKLCLIRFLPRLVVAA